MWNTLRRAVGRCQGRVRLIEPASIEISDLRTYDEGWYECSVAMLDEQTGQQASNNSSWVYLTVNGQHTSVASLLPSEFLLLLRPRSEKNCDQRACLFVCTLACVKTTLQIS